MIASIVPDVTGGAAGIASVNEAIAQLNGWKLVVTKADADAAAATMPVGAKIQTLEYGAGSGIGSNTYEVMDGSRPATEDAGYCTYIGATRWLKGLFIHKISIGQFGASGLAANDASTAMINCRNYVIGFQYDSPVLTNNITPKCITFESPKQYYRITTARAMMDDIAGTDTKRIGIAYRGESVGTQIHFELNADDYLLYNNNEHLKIVFENLSFTCDSILAKFMYSTANGGAQDVTYTNVHWNGLWQKLFVLRGTNNNSEWKWFGGGVAAEIADVMLDIADSDQFLNYWWYGHKLWLYDGQCIRATAGGHFKFFGCDWSGLSYDGTYNASANGGPLFELLGNAHARGVCDFQIHGGRFEHKLSTLNTHLSWFMYCAWNQGNIYVNADFTSNLYTDLTRTHAIFDCGNTFGPIVTWDRCVLMGKHIYRSASNGWGYAKTANYRDTSFYGVSDVNDCITLDTPTNKGGVWLINVEDTCRVLTQSLSNENIITATQIGAITARSNNVRTHQFTFRDANGKGIRITTSTITAYLPRNAIITNVRFFSSGVLTSGTAVNFQVRDTASALIAQSGSVILGDAWDVNVPVYYRLGAGNRTLVFSDANNAANQQSEDVFCTVSYIGA